MDALYAEYVKQRIIREPEITAFRLKITIINDDFKDWYWSMHGNIKGCNLKDLKAYLETRYGKYPLNGWLGYKISEEESEPEITEEFKVIQQINIKMGDLNKLIHELVELKVESKTIENKTEMAKKQEELDFYKEKYLANIKTNNCCIKCKKTYTDCVCFDGN